MPITFSDSANAHVTTRDDSWVKIGHPEQRQPWYCSSRLLLDAHHVKHIHVMSFVYHSPERGIAIVAQVFTLAQVPIKLV